MQKRILGSKLDLIVTITVVAIIIVMIVNIY